MSDLYDDQPAAQLTAPAPAAAACNFVPGPSNPHKLYNVGKARVLQSIVWMSMAVGGKFQIHLLGVANDSVITLLPPPPDVTPNVDGTLTLRAYWKPPVDQATNQLFSVFYHLVSSNK